MDLKETFDRARERRGPPESIEDTSSWIGLGTAPARYGKLVGVSPAMLTLFGVLARLEHSLASVLIRGESGTGKDLIARAIHEKSRISAGPFVAINCGAVDRSLARSEFFGHRKGAFTGAIEGAGGLFQAADAGTLFLDEIGELPLDVQPVLLRVLETRSVTRIGESDPRPVNVRVVAATNRDMTAELASGKFRRDLYHRLAVIEMHVPSLQQRASDIEPLALAFARELGLSLDDVLLTELKRRSWPGNVRELKNALEAFAVLGALPPESRPATTLPASTPDDLLSSIVDYERPYAEQKDRLIEAFTRIYLRGVLQNSQGNLSRAARVAGMHRAYLGRLVSALGLKSL